MEFKNKVILTADVANLNNNVYPLSELERIVNDNKDKVIYGMIEMPELISIGNGYATNHFYINDLERQAFASEIVGIVDNQLLVNVKVLDTPKGLMFKEMIKDIDPEDIHFRTAGHGEPKQVNGVLHLCNYILCSINYVSEPA